MTRAEIRSRRVTGVTVQRQRQPAKAVKTAREMALLPYATRSDHGQVAGELVG